MLILTKKRKAELIREVGTETRRGVSFYMSVGLDRSPPVVAQQAEIYAQEALRARISPYHNWRFWQRRKKCITIPCPPFRDVELEVDDV